MWVLEEWAKCSSYSLAGRCVCVCNGQTLYKLTTRDVCQLYCENNPKIPMTYNNKHLNLILHVLWLCAMCYLSQDWGGRKSPYLGNVFLVTKRKETETEPNSAPAQKASPWKWLGSFLLTVHWPKSPMTKLDNVVENTHHLQEGSPGHLPIGR